jgi:hypothetical protein
MKPAHALFLPASLILVLGCAGPTVHFDYDAKAAFPQYQAYDWQLAPKEAKARGGNPLADARVRRAVEAELAAKGFRREPNADPDFLITYYPTYEKVQGRAGRIGLGIGLSPMRGVGIGVGTALGGGRRRQMVGSIVLEITDFKSRQLVWRAVAEAVLKDDVRPEEAEQDVAAAVKELLSRFPPKGER